MNNLPPGVSNFDIERQQGDDVTTHEQELAEMTSEVAITRLRIIADLGNLPASSKHQLRLIADWMETIEFPLPADWAERAEWLDRQRMEAEEQEQ